jgi:AAHS family 3-hydroxyphenylpropionic acid transporter
MTAAPNRTFLLCFLAGMCEGYDLLVAGIAAPKFAPYFELEPARLGAVFAAATFGLFIGAILGGRIADRFGRKSVLVASLLLFGIFSIGTALVHDVGPFLLMRLLVGLGLGGALPNMLALNAEAAPPEHTAIRTTMLGSAMPFGGGAVALIVVSSPEIDWRTMFWIGGLAPIVVALLIWAALPESAAFKQIRTAQAPSNARLAIAGEGRLKPSVLLWISSFFTSLVLYMMVNWLPSLMEAKGFARSEAAAISMLMTIGGGASGFVFGALIARVVKRSGLYAWTWAGMLASIIGLAIAPHQFAFAAAGGAAIGFFLSAGQFLLYALGAEI